eukprot:754968-Hanusia_phi.AAC.5
MRLNRGSPETSCQTPLLVSAAGPRQPHGVPKLSVGRVGPGYSGGGEASVWCGVAGRGGHEVTDEKRVGGVLHGTIGGGGGTKSLEVGSSGWGLVVFGRGWCGGNEQAGCTWAVKEEEEEERRTGEG